MKTDVKTLLKELVEIPSVSHHEDEISSFVCGYLRDNGIRGKRYGNNVYCSVGKGKPSVLLNTHMDTVPVCPGWTRDPFRASVSKGRLYGLGSNDAKGSLAAMMSAMVRLNDTDLAGTVFFGASVGEECGNTGIVELLEILPPVDAAVVGEPTGLDIAIAMRGLAILRFTAVGKSAHGSRPEEGVNAIYGAARDIIRLSTKKFDEHYHDLLGSPGISVTLISGGTKNNVIPGRCEFTVDARSIPSFDNDAMIFTLQELVDGEMEVVSNRFHPCEIGPEEPIVKAAMTACPQGSITGFKGMSDRAFIRAPCIILGPGSGLMSHAPDECIEIAQVEKACTVYHRTVSEFLGCSP